MKNRKTLVVVFIGLAHELLAFTNSVETIRKQLDDIICPTIQVQGVNIVDMVDYIKDALTDYDARQHACCGSLRQLTNQVAKTDTVLPPDRRLNLLKDSPLVYMTTNFISVKAVLDSLKTYGVSYEITPDKIFFKNGEGVVFDYILHEPKKAQLGDTPNPHSPSAQGAGGR